jgi:hypothetical protein
VAPCILVDRYQHFRFICCLRFQDRRSPLKIEDALFCKTLSSASVISICGSGVNNEFIDFDQFEYLLSQHFSSVMGLKLLLEDTNDRNIFSFKTYLQSKCYRFNSRALLFLILTINLELLVHLFCTYSLPNTEHERSLCAYSTGPITLFCSCAVICVCVFVCVFVILPAKK